MGAWKNLWNSFLAGILVLLPLVLSLLVLGWVFTKLTNWLPPGYRSLPIRVAVLMTIFLAVSVIGWVTRLVIGKQLHAVTESAIQRVPGFNRMYGFFKEISSTLLGSKKTVFERVVLVEFPRPGAYAIGFVTSETQGEIQTKTQSQVINVFLPTTPNPTSGFLLMIPREQAIPLQMTVTEGMKLVISGGSVVPRYTPPPS